MLYLIGTTQYSSLAVKLISCAGTTRCPELCNYWDKVSEGADWPAGKQADGGKPTPKVAQTEKTASSEVSAKNGELELQPVARRSEEEQ